MWGCSARVSSLPRLWLVQTMQEGVGVEIINNEVTLDIEAPAKLTSLGCVMLCWAGGLSSAQVNITQPQRQPIHDDDKIHVVTSSWRVM